MPYTVRSSEKLRKSGADAETKAMLYLMNFRKDSSEMNYFVVDFFNDVTGMDRMGRKLWDVQSKASKTASAKGIGRELVTLFKNYLSEFTFVDYVIFMGGVPDTFRIDSSQNLFEATNINEKALISVRKGLIEESEKKEYIDNCNSVQREHDKKLNNGLPILHMIPPYRDYGRYFCIQAGKGGTMLPGLIKYQAHFLYPKQEVLCTWQMIRT